MNTELNRIEQDRFKFGQICKAIGYNNAVEGINALTSVESDLNKVNLCFSLGYRLINEPSIIDKLRSGNKIVLGVGC